MKDNRNVLFTHLKMHNITIEEGPLYWFRPMVDAPWQWPSQVSDKTFPYQEMLGNLYMQFCHLGMRCGPSQHLYIVVVVF